MYCIIVYDIGEKRVNKVCKFLRKHLFWVQNSVFEGEITDAGLFKVKRGLEKIIKPEDDSIIIFSFDMPKWIKREVMGVEKNAPTQII